MRDERGGRARPGPCSLARNVLSSLRMADLFGHIAPLQSALDYHLDRHNILVSNVAHVDTPGYVPRDLARTAEGSFEQTLTATMAKTNPGHLEGAVSSVTTRGQVFKDPAPGVGADKNSVSIEREAAKIATNQLRYDVSSALATAELACLAYAASDGRGG